MSAAAVAPSMDELFSQLTAVVDQLVGADLSTASVDSLLALARGVETAGRRLEAVQLAVINRIDELHVPFDHGCASTAEFVAQLLRISRAHARVRVQNAAAFGPRHDQYGERLEPIFTVCAGAVAEGVITAQAARSIQREIEKLPDDITCDMGEWLEADMVAYARNVDAGEAGKYAQQLRYRLDQDGQLRDEATNDRARSLARHRNLDGSARYVIDATCELAELMDTVLDATSAPEPAENGAPDPRTPAQRGHDGLVRALRLLLQTGRLPDTAGCRTTVILHADVDDFIRGEGTVTTGHGYAVPAETAARWREPEARAVLVLLSRTRGIEAYSSTARLFTEQQRLAMLARDGGCSFVDCDKPGAWTQAHHVTEYSTSGHTHVSEGALVCGEHHRAFEKLGWRNVMLAGRPAWIPPAWIDPSGAPRTNARHHPSGRYRGTAQ